MSKRIMANPAVCVNVSVYICDYLRILFPSLCFENRSSTMTESEQRRLVTHQAARGRFGGTTKKRKKPPLMNVGGEGAGTGSSLRPPCVQNQHEQPVRLTSSWRGRPRRTCHHPGPGSARTRLLCGRSWSPTRSAGRWRGEKHLEGGATGRRMS